MREQENFRKIIFYMCTVWDDQISVLFHGNIFLKHWKALAVIYNVDMKKPHGIPFQVQWESKYDYKNPSTTQWSAKFKHTVTCSVFYSII